MTDNSSHHHPIKIDQFAEMEKNLVSVELIPEFMYVPRSMILGSYGGGDEMQAARQIVNFKILVKDSKDLLDFDRITANVADCIKENAAIPKEKRVAHLPEVAPSAADLRSFKITWNIQISSQVYGENVCNLMYQGLLFAGIPNEQNRQGAISYPLVGIYPDKASVSSIQVQDNQVEYVGLNRLKWAEQHVHLVDIDTMWHFGPDMAKFQVDSESACISFWAMIVDLNSCMINCTYTIILRGDLESSFEISPSSSDNIFANLFESVQTAFQISPTDSFSNILHTINRILI